MYGFFMHISERLAIIWVAARLEIQMMNNFANGETGKKMSEKTRHWVCKLTKNHVIGKMKRFYKTAFYVSWYLDLEIFKQNFKVW